MDKQQMKRGALRLAVESALIVFSVLLAFFLDDYKDELKKEQRTATAVANIVKELESNKKSVESAIAYHRKVHERLMAAAGSELTAEMSLFDVLAQAAPNGLLPPSLQTTAWETAHASDIFQNLKYEKSYALSFAYKLQETGVDTTWKTIAASLMSARAFESGVKRSDIRYLAASFGELASQEDYLVSAYRQTLEKLK